MSYCRVGNCHRISAPFSHLCQSHRSVYRTHGDPLQRGVTLAELKPYVRAVRSYVERRGGGRTHEILADNWSLTVRSAEKVLEQAREGKAQDIHQRRAAQIITDIGQDHHVSDIAFRAMALGYWYQDQPRRWASDRGFQFQAARLIRKFARGEVAYSWRPDGSMSRSSTRRCPIRVTEHLWKYIYQTGFVGFGIEICKQLERGRQQRQEKLQADLMEILGTPTTPDHEREE